MSNLLTPIKVLLDMDVKTKSTYRAALEGIDLAFAKTLQNIDYNSDEVNNTIELYRQPTDIRLMVAKDKLREFVKNKEVGLFDFVKHARTTMHDFLDVIKLGFLHSLHMDNSGLFNVEIACMLHESGLEHNTSTAKKFNDQLNFLAELGLADIEKSKGIGSYLVKDTENNRTAIKRILQERGAMLVCLKSCKNHIDSVSFKLDPKNLHKFAENTTDYALPVTDELNDDEMIKLKKLVAEIPSSLAFIKESPDMLQTCGFVAESSFAEIEDIVAFDGIISKRVRERHEKERAANMNIHEIEKEVGSNFPVDIARDVMEKINATMSYFCVANLHATTRNLMVDEWGNLKLDIRISHRSEDLHYTWFAFDEDKYSAPSIPEKTLIEDVFDVVENRNGGLRLNDTENNRNTIEKFFEYLPAFSVDSISIIRDNCYITKTKYGQEVTNLENTFVIDTISVSTDNIEKILELYEKCGIKKKGNASVNTR